MNNAATARRQAPEKTHNAQVTSTIASTHQLVKRYGDGKTAVTALDSIDVGINRGELTVIMGPSGSGKSTLMHCLAGLDSPTSGTVKIADRAIHRLNRRQLTKLRRTEVGFIFQAFNLVPTLTAEENITLPLALARQPIDHDWFHTVVDAVGLRSRLDHRPGELSGGQQQRVACARALLARPAIVFADEPTGNLDSQAASDVLTFLRRCVENYQQSIVMVTHDPAAAAYAHRVLLLADGRLAGEITEPTTESILSALLALGQGKKASVSA